MAHHIMLLFLRAILGRMATSVLYVAPVVVLLVLCLVYGPIAYAMVLSTINPDQEQS